MVSDSIVRATWVSVDGIVSSISMCLWSRVDTVTGHCLEVKAASSLTPSLLNENPPSSEPLGSWCARACLRGSALVGDIWSWCIIMMSCIRRLWSRTQSMTVSFIRLVVSLDCLQFLQLDSGFVSSLLSVSYHSSLDSTSNQWNYIGHLAKILYCYFSCA